MLINVILIHFNNYKNLFLDLDKVFDNEDEKEIFKTYLKSNKYNLIKNIRVFIKNTFGINKTIKNIYFINEDKIYENRFKCKSINNYKLHIQVYDNNYKNKYFKFDSIRRQSKRVNNYCLKSYFNSILEFKSNKNINYSNLTQKKNKAKPMKLKIKKNIKKNTSFDKFLNFLKPKKIINFKGKSTDQIFSKYKFLNLKVISNPYKFYFSSLVLISTNMIDILSIMVKTKIISQISNKKSKRSRIDTVSIIKKKIIQNKIVKKLTIGSNKKNLVDFEIKKKKKFILKKYKKNDQLKTYLLKKKNLSKKNKFKLKFNKRY